MAALLTAQSCTVTLAHSKTRNLPHYLAHADIVVADAGDDVGGAEIVAVELLGVGNVQFADEAGSADR